MVVGLTVCAVAILWCFLVGLGIRYIEFFRKLRGRSRIFSILAVVACAGSSFLGLPLALWLDHAFEASVQLNHLLRASLPWELIIACSVGLWCAAFVGSMLLSHHVRKSLRAICFAAAFSIFLTPSLVVGEGGAAPVPAILVVFLPDHALLGVVPIAVVFILAFCISSYAEHQT